jgi:hypothetical protein
MTTENWTGPVGRLWTFDAIRADGGPGRSTVHELIKAGRLEPIKVGNLTRVTGRSWDA